jgi:hypothetical protein
MTGIELVVSTYLSGVVVAYIGCLVLIGLQRTYGCYVNTFGEALIVCAIVAALSWVGVLALILHEVLSISREIRQIWVERRRK